MIVLAVVIVAIRLPKGRAHEEGRAEGEGGTIPGDDVGAPVGHGRVLPLVAVGCLLLSLEVCDQSEKVASESAVELILLLL